MAWPGGRGVPILWRMETPPGPSLSRIAAAESIRPSPAGDGSRILVVEDDDGIRGLVCAVLGYQGYTVDAVMSGRGAMEVIRSDPPALVVLDVLLPDLDGFEIVRRLRRDGVEVPVLFLTARDATADRVAGLDLGGDDYLTKPFEVDELRARVRALLRRAGTPEETTHLVFSDIEMDVGTRQVRRGGTVVELTATEFDLLRYFLQNPRLVLSKAQLLRAVWNYEAGEENLVETYISYLRKKLDPLGPPLLHTHRGAGYALQSPSRL